MTPDDPRHGSTRGYRAHRDAGESACPSCVAAMSRYNNLRRMGRVAPRVPATGTTRRLQALLAIGWDQPSLSTYLGLSPTRISNLTRGLNQTVLSVTAVRVTAVYEQLAMQPRHDTRGARYARTVAAREGYAPPLAWDDIDNDAAPKGVRIRELVQRHDHHTWEDHDELQEQGYTRAQIAYRLGMTVDALEKALARRPTKSRTTRPKEVA